MDKFKEQNEEWQRKLLGNTLLTDDAETTLDTSEIVRMSELPQPHRILLPGHTVTRDVRFNRLNVFVDEDYKITQVFFS